MSLTMHGGKDLAKALDALSAKVSKRLLIEALTEAAEPMRQSMARHAPVDPGKPDLRDTMTINRSRGEDVREAAVAVGPSKAGWYGSFQEFGTKHHGAQPFVRPAFDETAQQCLNVLGEVLWRELAGRGVHRPTVIAEGPVIGEEV